MKPMEHKPHCLPGGGQLIPTQQTSLGTGSTTPRTKSCTCIPARWMGVALCQGSLAQKRAIENYHTTTCAPSNLHKASTRLHLPVLNNQSDLLACIVVLNLNLVLVLIAWVNKNSSTYIRLVACIPAHSNIFHTASCLSFTCHWHPVFLVWVIMS